jgi:3',5'-cyclic-nucleotide phosphodiesterase
MKRNLVVLRIFIVVLIVVIFSGCARLLVRHETVDAKFIAIPLGTKGGLIESDLSSYLLAPAGDTNFIALDAGTLLAGLRQAKQKGSFKGIEISSDSPLSLEGIVMQNHIKAYVISHAHMDHVAGMVMNAPDDTPKPILGLPSTIDTIRDHLFNWKTWPNFADDGKGFQLKKYRYVRLTPGKKQQVQNTAMMVVPYELSHSGGYLSTAFLVESGGKYILYFGDVGPDAIEKSNAMRHVWTAVAPLVRKKKLHGIFLESSFSSNRPDNLLFGHLTPKWMMEELRTLAKLANPDQPEVSLSGLKVVVTHIKPTLNRNDSPEITIMNELSELNDLGIEFILPESGKRLVF